MSASSDSVARRTRCEVQQSSRDAFSRNSASVGSGSTLQISMHLDPDDIDLGQDAQANNSFLDALSSNRAWAARELDKNPNYFKKLASGQSPSILWIGCSDSRVPETTILGVKPGDVFVHRNIANIISATDINTSAVIEFAIGQLKVKHIVVCGHSSCGGATAVLDDSPIGGVLDTWLTPLKDVCSDNQPELGAIADPARRIVRLAEMNVEAGVKVVTSNNIVQQAIRERGLAVHGCLFDLSSGHVLDLGFGTKASKLSSIANL